MSDRLAAAHAALSAGRRAEAIEHLVAAVREDPSRPVQVWRALVVELYGAGRYGEGETFAREALAQHPRDYPLLNALGVMLRKLGRQAEALTFLEQAVKQKPADPSGLQNMGNVLLDLGLAARAETVFSKLVRADPRNSEHQRQLGRSLARQGKLEPALMRYRQAVAAKKENLDAWLDMISLFTETHRPDEAEEAIGRGLQANPGNARLLEAKAMCLRRSGQLRAAEAYLLELLPLHENAAWLHYQLGTVISDWARERGNLHMRRAVELEPERLDYAIALVESLERTRSGGDEGQFIEESYQLAKQTLTRKAEYTPSHSKVIHETFIRVCAFDEVAALGDWREMGQRWASTGRHTALMKLLPRGTTDESRRTLLKLHRTWGEEEEKKAAVNPISRPRPRPAGGKVRVGFLSSDLRRHPVGYFAQPLFDKIDRNRFEVFVYSFYQGQEDSLQKYITERVDGFRWWPDISIRDAAQKIAEDQLDMLIELGGSTHMNKLEVMAYKPAALAASWLGYPHSAGLTTIDYLVIDPYLQPDDLSLLIEKPLPLPHAWYALGSLAFREEPAADPESPAARNGYVTFGTANQPFKYSPAVFAAWAEILRRVPGSKFMFVRPEGTSASFRANVCRHFEAGGVSADRIIFEAVRGRHLPFYNQMDISLDPFPQTGGTTTCESLWMGAPVITLVGETVYERLSYSVLKNLGLDAFCTRTTDAYIEAAVTLANDREQLAELRRTLRDRMKASPLGQTDQFARDFYDVVEAAVRASGR